MNRRRLTGHRVRRAGGGNVPPPLPPPLHDVAAYWPLEDDSFADVVGDSHLWVSGDTDMSFPPSKHGNGWRVTGDSPSGYRALYRSYAELGVLGAPQDGFSFSCWSCAISLQPALSFESPPLASLGWRTGDGYDDQCGWALFRCAYTDLNSNPVRKTQFFTSSEDGTVSYVEETTIDPIAGDGVWIHYCATRAAGENARMRLYVNGVMVEGVSAGSKTPFDGAFRIGTIGFVHPAAGDGQNICGTFISGGIDEAAYWTRELTPEEVAALYNDGAGLFLDP